MFKVSSAVRLLLSSGGASVKLFTHNSGIRTAVALQLKESEYQSSITFRVVRRVKGPMCDTIYRRTCSRTDRPTSGQTLHTPYTGRLVCQSVGFIIFIPSIWIQFCSLRNAKDESKFLITFKSFFSFQSSM